MLGSSQLSYVGTERHVQRAFGTALEDLLNNDNLYKPTGAHLLATHLQRAIAAAATRLPGLQWDGASLCHRPYRLL
jgi:hypothetical protein